MHVCIWSTAAGCGFFLFLFPQFVIVQVGRLGTYLRYIFLEDLDLDLVNIKVLDLANAMRNIYNKAQ